MTNRPKGTPGPWEWHLNEADLSLHSLISWASPKPLRVLQTCWHPTDFDARLIAKAPQMVEFVKAIADGRFRDPADLRRQKRARALLAEIDGDEA